MCPTSIKLAYTLPEDYKLYIRVTNNEAYVSTEGALITEVSVVGSGAITLENERQAREAKEEEARKKEEAKLAKRKAKKVAKFLKLQHEIDNLGLNPEDIPVKEIDIPEEEEVKVPEEPIPEEVVVAEEVNPEDK